MFINVRANNAGHKGRYRAGRFFENGSVVRLELVPDPPAGYVAKGADGLVSDAARLPLGDDGKPSMTHITRSGRNQLAADPLISLLEDAETQGDLSRAAFEEARAQAKAATDQLADARIRIAELQETVKSQQDAIDALEDKLAAMEEDDEEEEEEEGETKPTPEALRAAEEQAAAEAKAKGQSPGKGGRK